MSISSMLTSSNSLTACMAILRGMSFTTKWRTDLLLSLSLAKRSITVRNSLCL